MNATAKKPIEIYSGEEVQEIPTFWPVYDWQRAKQNDEEPTIACYNSCKQTSNSTEHQFEFRPKNKGDAMEVLSGRFGAPPNTFLRVSYVCKARRCNSRIFVYISSERRKKEAYFDRDPDEITHGCIDPCRLIYRSI